LEMQHHQWEMQQGGHGLGGLGSEPLQLVGMGREFIFTRPPPPPVCLVWRITNEIYRDA
jgi:hypothetical protein